MIAWALAAVLVGCGPKVALPEIPAAPQVPAERPDPVAVLVEGAGSLDPSARAHALAWLVRVDREPGAPSWAQRGLWDPEPWVQRQVVHALADRHEDASDEVLLGFVRRDVDPYVRATAGMRLRDRGVATEAFAEAWRAEPAAWRRAPLALVAASSGDPEARAPLAGALERGDIGLEVEFFEQVGASGLVDLVAPLRVGAEVAEPELALPYAAARLRLGDETAEEALRHGLSAEDSEERLYALDVVTALPADRALPLLRRARGGDDAPGWYAALALVALGEGDATRLVLAAARPEREIRQQAARFAGDLAPDRPRRDLKSARDALRIAFADPDAEVRRTAIASLVRLGLDGEDDWLRALLHDDDPAVRIDAAGALLRLGVAP